ncbi:hypothetical protein FFLO_04760 [Filobasidium floriforme]|uniref:Uncharacterized protein n=1 Tax=Filobasidium floriforme TaxID=5210 RepID=A0A8K0NPI6_9TREE|nr:uncharacterized protein HD553DRAFT_324834 [Filobasidium floriforme]KAG7530853.1 hypothetical protein FFLO_04760 [Filobasidium floriforme]KAH8082535.1 hypothetical protein HD553DRAFT_324834 [Filobasidium floriforme]
MPEDVYTQETAPSIPSSKSDRDSTNSTRSSDKSTNRPEAPEEPTLGERVFNVYMLQEITESEDLPLSRNKLGGRQKRLSGTILIYSGRRDLEGVECARRPTRAPKSPPYLTFINSPPTSSPSGHFDTMPEDASYQETVPSQTDLGSDSMGSSWFSDWEAQIPDEPTFAELVFTKYKELQGQPVKGPQDQIGMERLTQFVQSYNDSEDELRKQARLDIETLQSYLFAVQPSFAPYVFERACSSACRQHSCDTDTCNTGVLLIEDARSWSHAVYYTIKKSASRYAPFSVEHPAQKSKTGQRGESCDLACRNQL